MQQWVVETPLLIPLSFPSPVYLPPSPTPQKIKKKREKEIKATSIVEGSY